MALICTEETYNSGHGWPLTKTSTPPTLLGTSPFALATENSCPNCGPRPVPLMVKIRPGEIGVLAVVDGESVSAALLITWVMVGVPTTKLTVTLYDSGSALTDWNTSVA